MLPHSILTLTAYLTVLLPPGGPPVVAADVYLASDLSRPVRSVEVDAGSTEVVVPFTADADAVLMLRRHDGRYYLHGPMKWPREARTVAVDATPRYGVEGAVPEGARSRERPFWMHADDLTGEWPRCDASSRLWRCVGVPADGAGLVVFSLEAPVRFAVVRPSAPGGAAHVPVRSAHWATLISVDGDPRHVERSRVQVVAPRASAARTPRLRISLQPAPRASAERLTGRTWLVSGTAHQDGVLLQVEGDGVSLARVPLDTEMVRLHQRTTIVVLPAVVTTGQVVDRSGRPAEGARLILAEILEQTAAGGRTRTVKRQVAEIESGPDGLFALDGLGAGRFELLGLHPHHGRGTLAFQPGGRPLLLRLNPGRRVAGRVVRNGLPVPGVWVDVPATHDAYLTASDPMDAIAPAAATGPDGRFQVVLPQRGAVELRLDHGGVVTRVPLPGVSDDATLDLGDLALHGTISVRVTYAGDERCALVAAGPLGHTGMTLVEAQPMAPGTRTLTLPEPGRWLLELRCGRVAARAEPPLLDVPAQVTEWSAHVMMAPP